jgi:tetratricopeptide (TPR) repeat protein
VLQHVRRLMTTTMGFDPPGILQCTRRIKELCRQLGETKGLYSALSSEWMHSLVAEPLPRALRVAEEMLRLGEEERDATITVGAYGSLANTTFFMGRFAQSKEFAEKGLSAVGAASLRRGDAIPCLCFDALASWQAGDFDWAIGQVERAIAEGETAPSPHSLAVALYFDGYVRHFSGAAEEAAKTASRLIQLSRANDFKFWLAGAYVQLGWARVLLGSHTEGFHLLDEGIREWSAAGGQLIAPYWLAMFIEALDAAGRIAEALPKIQEALRSVDRRGETWWKADLLRLGAAYHLKTGNPGEAREWIGRGLQLAQAQGARWLAGRLAALSHSSGLDVEAGQSE